MKKFVSLMFVAAVFLLAASQVTGCLFRARPGVVVATSYYTPMYYNGYIVYYDAMGLPMYYAGGVRYYVPRHHPRFGLYVGHWRRHRGAYGRWYRHRGFRLRRRGYRRRGYRRRGRRGKRVRRRHHRRRRR